MKKVINYFIIYFDLYELQLIEYDDENDTADLSKIADDSTFWNIHNLADASWDNSKLSSDLKSQSIKFAISQNSSSLSFQENGSFSITVGS